MSSRRLGRPKIIMLKTNKCLPGKSYQINGEKKMKKPYLVMSQNGILGKEGHLFHEKL